MSGSIKLKHASGNGVSITAPSSIPAADRTLELPSDADGIIAKTDTSGNLNFDDNKKINVGDSSDLEIYHNGTHSHIDEAANGNLVLRTNPSGTYSTIVLQAGQENSVICNKLGSTELYHIAGVGSSSKKFETLSTGVRAQGGICFGSDTATANHLDDYEEGSYTPVVRASNGGTVLTYGAGPHNDYNFKNPSGEEVATVAYTKIGNRCFLSFSIFFNLNQTMRYNMTLPFTGAGSNYGIVGNPAYYGITLNNQSLGFLGANSMTTFDTYVIDANGSHTNVPINTNSEVYYFFNYQTV